MRSDRERLIDILEAIEKIEKYKPLQKEKLETDELLKVWILHHLQIIGEAVKAITQDTKNNHTEIPWKQIAGMRNILIHSYFDIDVDVVWAVLTDDLLSLKANLQKLQEES